MNTSIIKCPLCKSKNHFLVESIDTKQLIRLYKKQFHLSIFELLKNLTHIDYYECANCRLRYFFPLIIGDEIFYNRLQKFSWYYLDDKTEYQVSKKYINENDSVLEIGSGKGAFANILSKNNYVGLDFSKNAKQLAALNGIKIENESIHCYAEKKPELFDVVVSFQVLEHIPDPFEFIESALKTLKTGGKLIIAVPNDNSFLKYESYNVLNMPPHHVTRWSEESLEYIAEKFNLEIINKTSEALQDIHCKTYLQVLIEDILRKRLKIRFTLLPKNILSKIISKVAIFLTCLLPIHFSNEMRPKGHTVLFIYKKV